jgi:hypothetical protein
MPLGVIEYARLDDCLVQKRLAGTIQHGTTVRTEVICDLLP